MKDKIIPVVAVLSLIFIILVSIIVGKKIKQYVPNSEEQNLEEYFGIYFQYHFLSFLRVVLLSSNSFPFIINK